MFRDQSAVAVEAIRSAIAATSEAALSQIKTSFAEIGTTSEALRANHMVARNAVDQANASLLQQTGTMAELVAQLAKRLRTTSDEVESSGALLSRSLSFAAEQLGSTLAQTSGSVSGSLQDFEKINRSAAARTQAILGELETRIASSTDRLNTAADKALSAARSLAQLAPASAENAGGPSGPKGST